MFHNHKEQIKISKMKLFKTIALVACVILGFFACNNNDPKAKEKQLETSVLALHDSTMAQMETLANMQESVKKIITADSTKAKEGSQVLNSLADADNAMMDWMNNYDGKYIDAGHTHEEVMTYLTKQKTSIEAAQKKMNEGISQSKKFVNP